MSDQEENNKINKGQQLVAFFGLYGQGAGSIERITKAINLIEELSDDELLYAHGMCYKGEGVDPKRESRFEIARETIRAAIELRYARASLKQASNLENALNQMTETNQIQRDQIEEQRRLWDETKTEAETLGREKENKKAFIRNVIIALISAALGSFLTYYLSQNSNVKDSNVKDSNEKTKIEKVDSVKVNQPSLDTIK